MMSNLAKFATETLENQSLLATATSETSYMDDSKSKRYMKSTSSSRCKEKPSVWENFSQESKSEPEEPEQRKESPQVNHNARKTLFEVGSLWKG